MSKKTATPVKIFGKLLISGWAAFASGCMMPEKIAYDSSTLANYSTEAEDHLRMKYSRTKSRIKTVEAFIDRLASESSWTGKPYTLRCANDQPEPSKQWLHRKLEQYRQH